MTTTPHAAAALLRRAADRLDNLDHAATPHPWRAVAYEFEAETASVDTLAGPVFLCPDDGIRCVADRKDADLIVALRPVAVPLAAWLRHQAEYAERLENAFDGKIGYIRGHGSHAVAVARAVLGETDGGEGR